jgi:hypothetical protein
MVVFEVMIMLQISTKQNKQSLLTEYKKDYNLWVVNPGPGLGQAHKCGRVKPVDGIPTLPSW